jgi:hypothetical protein
VEVSGDPPLAQGAVWRFRVALDPWGLFWLSWVADIECVAPPHLFVDTQRPFQGPFAAWRHEHRFTEASQQPETTQATDKIAYSVLPVAFGLFATIANRLGSGIVEAKLRRLFRYRHAVLRDDMKLFSMRGKDVSPMQMASPQASAADQKNAQSLNILVSGASGLVGSALVPFLCTAGHSVTQLSHSLRGSQTSEGVPSIHWDPETADLDAAKLEGFDAVIHLAGENLATQRWTPEVKARIRDSRIQGTTLLCQTLASLKNPPKTLICASAIGYYGNQGETLLTEVSEGATDFLGMLCRNWEKTTDIARDAGIRVVNLRIGVVLSPKGGALAKMLPPFLMGAGGPMGHGKQWMSWVAVDDVVGAIHHVLVRDAIRGPINVVAPHPERNKAFSQTLGKVLFRPAFAPIPALAMKLMFGEMADTLMLSSTRVSPVRLLETGYQFRYPKLEEALRHVLGK